jgi:hypothetical protein
MTIEFIGLDGVAHYPSFDPSAREGVMAYYGEMISIGFIKAWRVI